MRNIPLLHRIPGTTDESTIHARSVFLIRILVGWVFISEGIQKFLFTDALGAGRFAHIGIPAPEIMAPFVGIVAHRAVELRGEDDLVVDRYPGGNRHDKGSSAPSEGVLGDGT